MTGPAVYLLRMLLFVAAVAAVAVVLHGELLRAFAANEALNGLILAVFALGVAYIFRQVLMLRREVNWIDNFRTGRPGLSVQAPPRLLAPTAAMLGDRNQHLSLSAFALRSLLDGIASRLDEQRDISRYMIGLLLFLGLLGTFWGLLQTIVSVGSVISGLTLGNGDLASVFTDLKRGLHEPLKGMGTAFSSSLFGLAGSLVLGFLELQAGQAQNRFYNDLEDWLAGQTKLTGAAAAGAADQPVPAYVQALLEQTADNLERLQRVLERGEQSRMTANEGVAALAERLSAFTGQIEAGRDLMAALAEGQAGLKPVLSRLAEGGLDNADLAAHIRSIDAHVSRLAEDITSAHAAAIEELRSEIRVLSRTIAAAAERGR